MAAEALRIAAEHPVLAADLQAHIAPYGRSRDDGLRCLAIKAGAFPIDIGRALVGESNPEARCLLLRRAAAQTEPDPADLLFEHLTDPDWRIRSAAADGMVNLGPRVLPRLKSFEGHDSPAVRAAASWIRERLG